MNKRMKVMIIILVIIFGSVIAYNIVRQTTFSYHMSHYTPPAITVSAITAREKLWQPRIPAVGNFLAIHGVMVSSEAAGIITQIFFKSGEDVKKGDALIQLDDSIEQSELKFNQSELTLQKINLKRQTQLLKHNATPSESVDTAEAKYMQAVADVEKIQAQIKQKHIQAPFTGRLGIREVHLGQYVTPGQTGIVSLVTMDPIFLQFYLPEQLFQKVHLNQEIYLQVEEIPNVLFRGKIYAVDSRIDVNAHNLLIQAKVSNCSARAIRHLNQPKGFSVTIKPDTGKKIIECDSDWNAKNNIRDFTFIPGMFADIQVNELIPGKVVVLPTTAISYSLYGNSVFILTKGPKDKKGQQTYIAKRHYIKTGETHGNYTVITSGVKPGDLVVSSGEFKLYEETPVVIKNDVKLSNINVDKLGQ